MSWLDQEVPAVAYVALPPLCFAGSLVVARVLIWLFPIDRPKHRRAYRRAGARRHQDEMLGYRRERVRRDLKHDQQMAAWRVRAAAHDEWRARFQAGQASGADRPRLYP